MSGEWESESLDGTDATGGVGVVTLLKHLSTVEYKRPEGYWEKVRAWLKSK